MRGFVGWTRRGFARQIRRWTTPPLSNRTSLRSGGFANKSGLCRVSEVANLQLWVTRRFPKPSPKRDRTITKATAVSPLSPRCPSVLRPNRVLLKEFLVTFVSKTKVTRPSACVASGAKWCLADFAQQNRALTLQTSATAKKQASLLRRHVKRLADPGQVVLIGGHDFSG